MWTIVEAELLREIDSYLDFVPQDVLDEVGEAKHRIAQLAAGNKIIGHDSHAARFRSDRRPGLRDPVEARHPLMARLICTALRFEPTAGPARKEQLQQPGDRESLLRACVYRYAPLFGNGCALDRIYRDPARRIYDDTQYAGAKYDADYCTGELMRQVLDVRLLDWFETLDALRIGSPAMFQAVWTRDALAVDAMLTSAVDLPLMPFLRMVKGGSVIRFRTLVGIFWEFERLFELLHALGGRGRVTPNKLRSALQSSSMLGAEIAADGRTGRYLATGWCHRHALAWLFDAGPAAGHDPRHPHVAMGASGVPTYVDEVAGVATPAGDAMAVGNITTAPPFAIDQRLRLAGGSPPAQFFAGRETRLLAIHFLLEVRKALGPNPGSRGVAPPRWFKLETNAAIGRLAMIITGEIFHDTAQSVLEEAAAEKSSLTGYPPSELAHLVANPEGWQALYGAPYGNRRTIAEGSNRLGVDLLCNIVVRAREEASAFIIDDPKRLGHSLCFRIAAWFKPLQEVETLMARWNTARTELRTAFPGCFGTVTANELLLAGRAASRMLPSFIDPWQDPHCRKPDRIRRVSRAIAGGTGTKRSCNVQQKPPKARPTAALQFAIARSAVTAEQGARVNHPIA